MVKEGPSCDLQFSKISKIKKLTLFFLLFYHSPSPPLSLLPTYLFKQKKIGWPAGGLVILNKNLKFYYYLYFFLFFEFLVLEGRKETKLKKWRNIIYFVLFCFVLFCFVLFYFILFYFILFYFICRLNLIYQYQ